MAVNVGTVPVYPDGSNNPQTGWTQAHVMDALEKAFYEMGFNSGTQKNGVPIAVLFPGYDTSTSTGFKFDSIEIESCPEDVDYRIDPNYEDLDLLELISFQYPLYFYLFLLILFDLDYSLDFHFFDD